MCLLHIRSVILCSILLRETYMCNVFTNHNILLLKVPNIMAWWANTHFILDSCGPKSQSHVFSLHLTLTVTVSKKKTGFLENRQQLYPKTLLFCAVIT